MIKKIGLKLLKLNETRFGTINLHSLDREGKKLLTSYKIHGYLGIVLFIKKKLCLILNGKAKGKKIHDLVMRDFRIMKGNFS